LWSVFGLLSGFLIKLRPAMIVACLKIVSVTLSGKNPYLKTKAQTGQAVTSMFQ